MKNIKLTLAYCPTISNNAGHSIKKKFSHESSSYKHFKISFISLAIEDLNLIAVKSQTQSSISSHNEPSFFFGLGGIEQASKYEHLTRTTTLSELIS